MNSVVLFHNVTPDFIIFYYMGSMNRLSEYPNVHKYRRFLVMDSFHLFWIRQSSLSTCCTISQYM